MFSDGGADDESGRVFDARLVPFAGVAWAATLLGILAGSKAAWSGAVVLSLVVVVVLSLGRGGAASRFAVAATLVFGVLVCCAIAWQAKAVEENPIARAAGDRSFATVLGSAAEDPIPLRSGGSKGWQQIRFRLNVEEARLGNDVFRVGGVVTVFAPADGWSEVLPGQRVRFGAKLDLPRRDDLTVALARTDSPPRQLEPASWYQRWAATVRDRFVLAAQRALPPDQAGLLPGLVVGDTSGQSADVADAFKASGLTHLTAVSGSNVSIVLGAVLLVVRAVGMGPRAATVLAALALAAFVVVVRPSPSVLRAAAMGSVTILAMVSGRKKQALPALSGSVVLLLLLHPALAVDFGFALSVFATGALIVLAPVLADRLRARGWPRAAAEVVAVATAAFVVTTPLVAAMAGSVSVVSIVANILVTPVVAVVTVVGGATALVAVVSVPFAEWGARSVSVPLWWLLTVADKASRSPGAAVGVPSGMPGAAVTVAVMVTVAALWSVGRALLGRRRSDVARSSRAQLRSGRSTPSRTR